MRSIAVVVILLGLAAGLGSPVSAQGAEDRLGVDRVVTFTPATSVDATKVAGRVARFRNRGFEHRFVTIDGAELLTELGSSGTVGIDIFGTIVKVGMVSERRSGELGSQYWVSTGDDVGATFTVKQGVLEGSVTDTKTGSLYQIVHAYDDVYLLVRDATQFPAELEPIELESRGTRAEPRPATGAAPVPEGDPGDPTIDILVWYDNNALTYYGSVGAAEAALTAAINQANTSASNSGSPANFNMVGVSHVNFTPATGANTLLSAIREKYDGVLDQIHGARDAANADLVAFATDLSGFCGLGYRPTAVNSPDNQTLAFTLSDADCIGGNLSMVHEIGHNLGAHHDVGASAPGPGLFSYAQGYVNPGLSYRSIMSYNTACAGCLRVPYFSNPTTTYMGNPLGSAAIDNARTIGELAPEVSQYRPYGCPPPPNDDWPARTYLGVGFLVETTGSNSCATREAAESNYAVQLPAETVWYEWTAPSTGTATITTCSPATTFDTYLVLYDSFGAGIIANNDDDAACDSNVTASTINHTVTAGTPYFISVDGSGDADGTFSVRISMPYPATILNAPCVVYDSATASDPNLDGPFAANEVRTVQVSGTLIDQGGDTSCVPVGAAAVMYTISAIDPSGTGNLRLSEEGVVPNGGVVNYVSNGLNNANTVSVPLPAGGKVDVGANSAATGVRLVVTGYYSSGGTLKYNALTPCAVADSRSGTAPFAGPFAAGDPFPDVDVVAIPDTAQGGSTIDCGVPATAEAVLVNVVAIGGTGPGWLAVGPEGTDPIEAITPFTSLPLNNATTVAVPLGPAGRIAVDVEALTGSPSTHIRLVVLGYLDQGVGSGYYPVSPCAAFDTRTGQGAAAPFLGERNDQTATTYDLTGVIPADQGGSGGDCGVPEGATAVLVNLVAIQGGATGNLRAYATGSTPTGGVLNFSSLAPPMNNSNAIAVPISAGGEMDVFVNAPDAAGGPVTHLRGVVLGYFK